MINNDDKKLLLEKIKELCKKEISLSDLAETLELNKYETLSLLKELENDKENIIKKVKDDDIYLFNNGERKNEDNYYHFETDENNEIKFTLISDTRIGSKYQQISILNDIYKKSAELGIDKVIHCGNITEGLYPVKNKYSNTLFLDDTMRQVNYVVENYPYIEGIKTYFINGTKDETHFKNDGINIGKRISEERDDMIYLGTNTCHITIDKVNMLLINLNLAKTYTISYRPQQFINSMRSEDKPNILLYGGLLEMQKFNYRNVNCISVPSVVATTDEMTQKRYSNNIGAWYITIKVNKKGYLESIKALASPYYVTNKEDYIKSKVLYLTKGDNK